MPERFFWLAADLWVWITLLTKKPSTVLSIKSQFFCGVHRMIWFPLLLIKSTWIILSNRKELLRRIWCLANGWEATCENTRAILCLLYIRVHIVVFIWLLFITLFCASLVRWHEWNPLNANANANANMLTANRESQKEEAKRLLKTLQTIG